MRFLLAVAASGLAGAMGSVPFELHDNRIVADVQIDGKGPFKFIFDTGGTNILTPEVARRLGLKTEAAGEDSGAGEARVPAGRTKVTRLSIGPVTLRDQDIEVLDLSAIRRAFDFASLDGVFGYEVLSRYAVRVDYDAGRLVFFEALTRLAEYSEVPFQIEFNKPVVDATIDGAKARLLIDTGDRSALTVFARLAGHRDIARAFEESPSTITGLGIGGPIPARLGTIDALSFGGLVFRDVAARAPTTKGGFNALPGLDASVGNEILSQLDIVFDYKRLAIYVRRGKRFGAKTKFTPVPHLVQ